MCSSHGILLRWARALPVHHVRREGSAAGTHTYSQPQQACDVPSAPMLWRWRREMRQGHQTPREVRLVSRCGSTSALAETHVCVCA
ncbi:hypothetical protein BC834DRAFT_900424 [Gloeopeniophorella convolvens]|nr:hypothetical protein BC834DRAFT_900424 [Gloeopeniophorella convolvens]